jgi:tRNA(Ile)-lysidine synthase
MCIMSRERDERISLMQAVVRYMRATEMTRPGDNVLCALSGGCDSVAMLLLLQKAAGILKIQISAAHVNHRLRGVESDRDEAFCRKLCKRRGISFTSLSGDAKALAQRMGKGVEAAARELRYTLLQEEAARQQALLATAHTSNDHLETMILNLLRGAGSAGLAGIPPKREGIIRPLLALSRNDTKRAVAAFGERYVTDSTNESDAFLRNRVRKTIVPNLLALNPAVLDTALRAGEALRMDASLLAEMAKKQNPFVEHKAPKKTLANLEKPLALRVLSNEAAQLGLELSWEQATALWRLACGQRGGRISLGNGVFFYCRGPMAFFERTAAE